MRCLLVPVHPILSLCLRGQSNQITGAATAPLSTVVEAEANGDVIVELNWDESMQNGKTWSFPLLRPRSIFQGSQVGPEFLWICPGINTPPQRSVVRQCFHMLMRFNYYVQGLSVH